MSGIAEVLANLGYQVQGSDMSENANVQRLRKLGVKVAVGHRAENLGEAQVVVVSSAIKAGNPEVDTARQRFIPIVRRAEMLGELMRLKWSIAVRSEEHTSELQSLMRISYAVFCLKKNKTTNINPHKRETEIRKNKKKKKPTTRK